jgi:ribose transport system substrate-binding protein
MNCGAQEEAKKQGVELDFQGPDQFDASLQTPIVNAVTQKKPDAILIAPTDTKALYVPIKQAADAGIKIVLVDTTLEQADLAVSQIASDNIVNPGISTTDLRAQGFEEQAKKLGLDYLGQQFNDDDPAKAAAITKAQLAKEPDLKGIFATNLFSAEGSASGLREADKLGDVKIVGFDAGPKQIEDLNGGLVQALVAQRPAEIGKLGVQQAVAALDGKPTKKEIGTGFVTLTKDNLKENPDIPYKSSC